MAGDSTNQSNQNKTKEVEDILAGIDSSSSRRRTAKIKVPPVTQTATGQEPKSTTSDFLSLISEKIRQNKKVLLISLALIILLIVIFSGSWFFKKGPKISLQKITNNSQMLNEAQGEAKNTPSNSDRQINNDFDFDGLTNEEEKSLGTDPTKADSDNDGLLDKEEIKIYQTDPLNPDTDGDGHQDGIEVKKGYDPKGRGKLFTIPPKQ